MITAVTLNTSIDKVYEISEPIEAGKVMRVSSCRRSAGGKGINVARVAGLCKEEVTAIGFTGGYEGEYFRHLAKTIPAKMKFITVGGETRSCINIITPDGLSTEFLEPGMTITEKELLEFLEVYEDLLDFSEVITLSGSIPHGLHDKIYAELIDRAKQKGRKVILDTSGKALAEGVKGKPHMIKPNLEELCSLTGKFCSGVEEAAQNAMMLQKNGIEMVVVSLGKDGAVLVGQSGAYHARPPILAAVNTVGCGDAMVGAFAVSAVRGYDEKSSLKFAVAVSAANALNRDTGYFTENDLNMIIGQVEISRLPVQ